MGGILTIHTSKFEDSTIKHRMATPPPGRSALSNLLPSL